MATYRLYQVDAFTRRRFTGNPAGVVLDADGLTDAEMQAVARELNNSETAFVLSPDGDGHDVRVRFFTPATEVPSCGHATVAAHYVRAFERRIPPGRTWQKIGIGTLPVDVAERDGDYEVLMTQGRLRIDDPLDADVRSAILAALGIDEDEAVDGWPFQHVSTGHGKILVPLRRRTCLHGLAPDMTALKAWSLRLGVYGYFVFTLDSETPGILAHGRMFAPAIGIAEDPVTGNGNGPLGAYLVHHGLVEAGSRFEFVARQGEAMGRPGQARVIVEVEDGRPVTVRVGGHAVVAFRTEIEI